LRQELIQLQSQQGEHLLDLVTYQDQLPQTQQLLEFLQPEEDKELKNGSLDNNLRQVEDLEAVEEMKVAVNLILLQVVTLVDTLPLKVFQVLMVQDKAAEEAAEPHKLELVDKVRQAVMVMEHKLVQLTELPDLMEH
jgi:hypothetical protein